MGKKMTDASSETLNKARLLRWRETEMDAAVKGKAHRTKSGRQLRRASAPASQIRATRERLGYVAFQSSSMWDVLSFEMRPARFYALKNCARAPSMEVNLIGGGWGGTSLNLPNHHVPFRL